jgi:hypothetical protein
MGILSSNEPSSQRWENGIQRQPRTVSAFKKQGLAGTSGPQHLRNSGARNRNVKAVVKPRHWGAICGRWFK